MNYCDNCSRFAIADEHRTRCPENCKTWRHARDECPKAAEIDEECHQFCLDCREKVGVYCWRSPAAYGEGAHSVVLFDPCTKCGRICGTRIDDPAQACEELVCPDCMNEAMGIKTYAVGVYTGGDWQWQNSVVVRGPKGKKQLVKDWEAACEKVRRFIDSEHLPQVYEELRKLGWEVEEREQVGLEI
jgi:hypothetical protein